MTRVIISIPRSHCVVHVLLPLG